MSVELSAEAMKRLGQLQPGAKGIFTSDLSVNEFLLVRQAGFRPLGLVLGVSIYHVGAQMRPWYVNEEMDVLSQAMYNARELAMTRMQAEAAVLGADGIVGVRLKVDLKEWGRNVAEFSAIGTAVKAEDGGDWRNHEGKPFTSDLSGQDFWTLLQAGYAPAGMVMGTCVYHVAKQTMTAAMSNVRRNVELPSYTQGLYTARELAMERMQAEAAALEAEGVVGVQLVQHSHSWSGHITEFFAIGTAVRPIREDHTIPTPQLVLGLDS